MHRIRGSRFATVKGLQVWVWGFLQSFAEFRRGFRMLACLLEPVCLRDQCDRMSARLKAFREQSKRQVFRTEQPAFDLPNIYHDGANPLPHSLACLKPPEILVILVVLHYYDITGKHYIRMTMYYISNLCYSCPNPKLLPTSVRFEPAPPGRAGSSPCL